MDSFADHMETYRREHSTLGCKITHMFGVPLIALSLPALFINWKIAIAMYAVGWALQFIGHFVFQKNKPVFLDNPRNPWTYLSALTFVGEEWLKLLTGKRLSETV